jgi:hypothetical protein
VALAAVGDFLKMISSGMTASIAIECSQRQLEYGRGLLDLMLDAPGTPRWKRLKRIAAI